MAFIQYVAEEEIPKQHRVPDTDNILQIHSVHPKVMRAHYDLYIELMRRPGPLERRQCEMIAVHVSSLNHCHY